MAQQQSNKECAGCFLPDKVGVRTSLETKLQEYRKRVSFAEGNPSVEAGKESACLRTCQTGTGDQNMIVTPIEHRQPDDCFTVGLKGYGQPYQHLLWTTSQSVHGRYPPPPGLNPARHPRNSSFTNTQNLGGCNASDGDFTTSTETGYIYKPMSD